MKNWQSIYQSNDQNQVYIIADLLKNKNIPVEILNKKDSLYVFLGQLEIYVPINFVEIAKKELAQINI